MDYKKFADYTLKDWLTLLLLLYLVTLIGIYVFQRSLLYHPSENWRPLSGFDALSGTEKPITAEDGTQLISWWLPGNPDYPTILYFHGNAGNLNNRAEKFRVFQQAGFNIFAVSFRGYGISWGSPSEAGFYRDGSAAIRFLKKHKKIPASQIILYGESIGSGVAVEMATRYPVKGVVLEAAFTSITDRAQELYPWVPVPLLLRDRFDNLAKIDHIFVPLLMFHNKGDKVVPIHHGKALFAAAAEPKKAYWKDGEGHVAFDWQEVARAIEEFHLP
jgi:hypothetical protein